MRKLTYYITSFFLAAVIGSGTMASPSNAGFGDFLKDAAKVLTSDGGLSNSEIVNGLKEALHIGTGNAVDITSKVNGYYQNPKIKIPLPESVQKVEKALRIAGYGEQVDDFVLSMNRAAEKAAPKAKSLFWDAIKQITFDDAKKILDGRENEATLYFKDKTWQPLENIFTPIVHDTMESVGVTRAYHNLESRVRSIPFTEKIVSFDLDEYVTTKALDGLFLMLAEEEAKIRKDPAARVTDLLKKVFGRGTS